MAEAKHSQKETVGREQHQARTREQGAGARVFPGYLNPAIHPFTGANDQVPDNPRTSGAQGGRRGFAHPTIRLNGDEDIY